MYGVLDAGLIGQYKCRIRILDSFGTEPICKSINYFIIKLYIVSFRAKGFVADEKGGMFDHWNFEVGVVSFY